MNITAFNRGIRLSFTAAECPPGSHFQQEDL
jgi:hypothetical protein